MLFHALLSYPRRRTGLALLFVALVALVATFPVPAAAAPADLGGVSVLDAWWGQISEQLGRLFGVFSGSTTTTTTTEPPPPPPPPPNDGGFGMGLDPDGRLPGDPDGTSSLTSSDPQVGSLLDPNG